MAAIGPIHLTISEAGGIARALVTYQALGSPQDIEFAYGNDGRLFLVQSRPITTLAEPAAGDASPAAGNVNPAAGDVNPAGTVLATGLGASPGVASGPVRILASPNESSTFRPCDVLVAPMTTPDWAPILRQTAGVVSDGVPRDSTKACTSTRPTTPPRWCTRGCLLVIPCKLACSTSTLSHSSTSFIAWRAFVP